MNSNINQIRLFGAGGHSEVVRETLEFKGISIYEIFQNDHGYVHPKFKDKIKNTEPDLNGTLIPNDLPFIIAIGDNRVRSDIRNILNNHRFKTIIHPSSTVSPTVKVGEGTVIFAGAIIQPNTKIGNHVIVNTGASIGHDIEIGDFVHISPRATITGNVSIGEGTQIGAAAVVIPEVNIGKWCVIGAGAVITKDVPDYCTVVGNPGRIIKRSGVTVEKNKEFTSNNPGTLKKSEQDFYLKARYLNDDLSVDEYKESHQKYWKNPYHSYAYFAHHKETKSELLILEYYQGKELMAQMPLIKREIENNIDGKVYYDVTSPYGYGGPIIKKPEDYLLVSKFWQLVDEWYQKEDIISEFIRFNLDGNHNGYTGSLVPTLQNVKGKILSDPALHWEQFKPKVRNNYRKAQNHGIEFEIFRGDEIGKQQILKFYEIYTGTMDRNQARKEYFFPIEYFYELIFSQPEQIALAFSSFQKEPISTELILIDNNSIYAYLGGTDRNHFDKRPNDFLRVEIIKWAVQHKFQWYILGGGRSDGDSLYKSKKYLFPRDTDCIFYTGRKIINENIYSQLTELQYGHNGSEINTRENYFPAYRGVELSPASVALKP